MTRQELYARLDPILADFESKSTYGSITVELQAGAVVFIETSTKNKVSNPNQLPHKSFGGQTHGLKEYRSR
jgi:hypothetical protein